MLLLLRLIKPKLRVFWYVYLMLAILIFSAYPQVIKAASLTAVSDVLTRLKTSETSNHAIQFTTPTGIANTDTIELTFAGFNIASVVTGDVTIEGAAVTSAVPAGQVLTITAGVANIVAPGGIAHIVISNNHITNPVAGTYTISIAGSFGDTGALAIAIITDDQVVVSTTIDPYISFAITQNSVTLTKNGGGNPDWNNTGYNNGAANTLAAATNGLSGYSISYNGATLSFGGNTIDAMAAQAASTTGIEQFGINLKQNTIPATGAEPVGSGTPSPGYDTANQYKYIVGTPTTLASTGGVSAVTTYTVTYIANVAPETQYGVYNTTITYICTANY